MVVIDGESHGRNADLPANRGESAQPDLLEVPAASRGASSSKPEAGQRVLVPGWGAQRSPVASARRL